MSDSSHRLSALLVDDDAEIRILLVSYLEKFGIQCVAVEDGHVMRRELSQNSFDVILLDLMLPGENGMSLLRQLRAEHKTPVIMLTARDEFADKILGLELGADDYIIKPFDTRELVARIQSVLRRSAHSTANKTNTLTAFNTTRQNEIRFQRWKLHCLTRQLTSPANMVIPLSNAEFRLLKAFLDHPGRVLSRDQLLDFARGKSSDAFDRSIDLLVSRLRQKLEDDPRQPHLLKTIRGEGYMLNTNVI
ncbi:response regulator [Undibacterium sp. SXout7W]|uniref:response regulator n=1 Tax=Undibacterium sp. SXout7W TaxID=3413049 RepID=UPI003BF2A5FA